MEHDFILWLRAQTFRVRLLVAVVTIAAAIPALMPKEMAPGEPKLAFIETLIILAVTVVLSELLRPKPDLENARAAGLGDFNFPTATEGRMVPIIWGRVRMKGPNVVWYGDLDAFAVRESVKTGLFSKTKYTKYYEYNLGVQMALCRGPDVVLKRVWVGESEVFSGTVSGGGRFDIDEPTLFSANPDPNGIQATCDFYSGTKTQTVNAYLDAVGRQRITTAATPTAPRYTGTCYVVLREMTSAAPTVNDNGAYLGNSTQIKPWSFEVERYPDRFTGQAVGENKIGSDCNPTNILYEILTNTEWGFGRPIATLDLTNFLEVSDTLIAEGNGMSWSIDRATKIKDVVKEIERQIDGKVFLDHTSGKWKIKLARADYDINTVLQVDESNIISIENFTKGSWEDTTNVIQVKYTKRVDDYKESYALGMDSANAIIQGGGSVTSPLATVAQMTFPGIMDEALAVQIAWRETRAKSYPLAKASMKITREGWQTTIGSVVAWTSATHGFSQLPMRVTSVDYGELTDNMITLNLIQDVYKFTAASFGNPPATNWVVPTVGLAAYASNRQIAIEAPRAILVRDPEYAASGLTGNVFHSRLMCAARRAARELGFTINQRNASGTPSGDYKEDGDCGAFMLIGDLTSALAAGTAIPTTTISIDPSPDGLTAIADAFTAGTELADLGVDLVNLILIGTSEFALVRSAAVNGSVVDLTNVYRGVLDTGQDSHAAGTAVYLVCNGAALNDTNINSTYNVDVKLLPFSSFEILAIGSATNIALTMQRRAIRPYPPSCTLYNGGSTPFATPNADTDGSGMNGTGFNVAWRRRAYTTTDEVTELTADNALVDASTEYRVKVFVDPDGANTLVLTSSWATGTGPVLVNRLLLWNEAAAGTEVRVQVEVRHDVASGSVSVTDLEGLYSCKHDTSPTSAYSAYFYLGGLRANDVSNTYTAASTGTFTIEIGAAYSTSNVQVQINGGGWVTEIAAGLTSGTFSATSGDLIQVRHTVNETPSPQLVQIKNPSSTIVAYGVLTN